MAGPRLGIPKPLPREQREQRILALTGGGMRGLFSAKVLELLEQRRGCSLSDCFTVFAGTSIGGILAIGLAAGIQPGAMRAAIREHGPSIFSRPWRKRLIPGRDLFATRYGQDALRNAIKAILGEKADTTLEHLDRPLLVTAVEHNRTSAKIFASKPLAMQEDDLSVTLIDVALATSAAPTFLPPHRIGDRVYLDGGLIANAPDLVAVQKCIERQGRLLEELHVLSVGTAAIDLRGHPNIGAPGRLGWVGRHNLFEITIDSQADLAISQARAFLGDRFHRIERAPARKIALDATGKRELDELERLGAEAVEIFQRTPAWSTLLVPTM